MKYCIRLDRPLPTWINGEECLTGCDIYGVHHNCEGCPNLTEMGDESYSFSSISEPEEITDSQKPATSKKHIEDIAEDHSNSFEKMAKKFDALHELAKEQVKKLFKEEYGYDEDTAYIAFIHGWQMCEKLNKIFDLSIDRNDWIEMDIDKL